MIMTLVVGWALTGLTIVVAGVLAGRSRRALRVGLAAVAFSLAGLGAVGLAVLVATDTDLSAIAAASYLPVVRDLAAAAAGSPLASVVVSLLIAVQATAGLLILFDGRWVETGLAAAVGVQVGLLALGWWAFLVSPLVITALVLLWRARRRDVDRPLYLPDILDAREHDRRS
ncbi:hypothetical protein GCM10022204_36710 [Microlunatus aurantiacus]|uniref:Uncharacterized protein n=2 Tax=Microlunatus aurantiacus TaxID=446786 RepID=A0ABP7E4N3_9ACTN